MTITHSYVDYGAGSDATGDGTVGTPWKTLQKAFDTLVRNTTDGNQVNLKAGTPHVNAAALSLTTFLVGGALSWAAPIVLRGYTATANDGGFAEIDCNGAALWAAAYQYQTLMDLEIHSFGNNHGIAIAGNSRLVGCEIHKGASSPSSKYLVSVTENVIIDGCYIHDPGTSGTCVFGATGGGLEMLNSYLAGGGTWLFDARSTGRVENCIFRVNAGTSGMRFYGVYFNTEALGCVFYSPDGATGNLLSSENGAMPGRIVNNIFVGGGGNAFYSSTNVGVVGYNAFYGNAANYSLADQVLVDWRAYDVALAANPFTDAANGDFSLTSAGKAALRGLGRPVSYLGAHANTDGHITIGPIQYGEAEAAADYPAESDVRLGVSYDTGSSTGTLDLPAVADVQSGVTFDGATKTGTFAAPAVGDVQSGVTYGAAAEYTGTFGVPDEADVNAGVTYGASGTEFTGTLVGGSDWTANEKKQFRMALGITGDTAATTGTGNLDTILAVANDLSTDEEIGAAVVAAMDADPPSVNMTTVNGVPVPGVSRLTCWHKDA